MSSQESHAICCREEHSSLPDSLARFKSCTLCTPRASSQSHTTHAALGKLSTHVGTHARPGKPARRDTRAALLACERRARLHQLLRDVLQALPLTLTVVSPQAPGARLNQLFRRVLWALPLTLNGTSPRAPGRASTSFSDTYFLNVRSCCRAARCAAKSSAARSAARASAGVFTLQTTSARCRSPAGLRESGPVTDLQCCDLWSCVAARLC